jgi:putative exporter of polyketide antibiotics
VTSNTPFTAIEQMTTKGFDAVPLVVLVVLAVALATLGLARLRSRDFVGG